MKNAISLPPFSNLLLGHLGHVLLPRRVELVEVDALEGRLEDLLRALAVAERLERLLEDPLPLVARAEVVHERPRLAVAELGPLRRAERLLIHAGERAQRDLL